MVRTIFKILKKPEKSIHLFGQNSKNRFFVREPQHEYFQSKIHNRKSE